MYIVCIYVPHFVIALAKQLLMDYLTTSYIIIGYDNILSTVYFPVLKVKVTVAIFRKTLVIALVPTFLHLTLDFNITFHKC